MSQPANAEIIEKYFPETIKKIGKREKKYQILLDNVYTRLILDDLTVSPLNPIPEKKLKKMVDTFDQEMQALLESNDGIALLTALFAGDDEGDQFFSLVQKYGAALFRVDEYSNRRYDATVMMRNPVTLLTLTKKKFNQSVLAAVE